MKEHKIDKHIAKVLADHEESKPSKLAILLWPFIMLKNILSANYWAEKIWTKTNMEEKVQGSRFNRWQNSLPQPYRFIFKTTFFIVAMYLLEMYFNLIGYSILPWRWF